MEEQQDADRPLVLLRFDDGTEQHVSLDFANESEFTVIREIPAQPEVDPTTAEGVRGVDYPAFDVSPEGVYHRERESPQQEVIDRLLDAVSHQSQAETQTHLRNILLTVSYMYAGEAEDEGSTTHGSVILHVPNIPHDQDQEGLQSLITLATMLAFRTITSTLKLKAGLNRKTFEKFPLAERPAKVEDWKCAICYDEYVATRKRRRQDEVDSRPCCSHSEKSQVSNPKKLKMTESGDSKSIGKPENSEPQIEYIHSAVEMPCGHIFGRSCLYEWLKSNRSCPLCRVKVDNDPSDEPNVSRPPVTTISLPNLANIVSRNRDLLSQTSRMDQIHQAQAQQSREIAARAFPSGTNLLRWILDSFGRRTPNALPMGVESRRTDSGVETRNIPPNDEDNSDGAADAA